jgi:hypothetical protein
VGVSLPDAYPFIPCIGYQPPPSVGSSCSAEAPGEIALSGHYRFPGSPRSPPSEETRHCQRETPWSPSIFRLLGVARFHGERCLQHGREGADERAVVKFRPAFIGEFTSRRHRSFTHSIDVARKRTTREFSIVLRRNCSMLH